MSIQNDLENVLESLSGIESVIGGLVTSCDGDLLGAYMPDIYDDELFKVFALNADMSAALSGLGIDQQESVINLRI